MPRDELTTAANTSEVDRMLGAPLNTVALKSALQAAADVLAAEVLVRTPVSREPLRRRPKRLRESLVVDVELDSNLRGGTARIGFGQQGYVARFLEYGTSRAPAYPFMRPALDVAADSAIEAFAESLGKTL